MNTIINTIQQNFRILMICLGILIFTAACAGNPKTGAVNSLQKISIPAEHVVFIGLDGWGGAYTSNADMPTVKRMISGGASSLDMRSVMPSISWPNWSSLFSGTPPEQRNGETSNNVSGIMDFPSIFNLTTNNKLTNVFFYDWDALVNVCPDKEAVKTKVNSDTESARKIAAYIVEKKPAFTAVVFNDVDSVGHNKGWGSKEYYAKLSDMDNFIAIIEQGVKDAGIYNSTVFVLSADHGGSFKGHGGNTKKHRQIPIVIYGRGIKSGYKIPSPLSICDIAPTMAAIMGLEPHPEWAGRPLKEVFK